ERPRHLAVFRIFAARAAAELQRLAAETTLAEREARLSSLVEGAMDGIIEFDESLAVHLRNPAASRVLDLSAGSAGGLRLDHLLTAGSLDRLRALMRDLECSPGRRPAVWIGSGLEAACPDGSRIPIESSLALVNE